MFRYCVEGHGLARIIGDRQTAGLDDLVGLFQGDSITRKL